MPDVDGANDIRCCGFGFGVVDAALFGLAVSDDPLGAVDGNFAGLHLHCEIGRFL